MRRLKSLIWTLIALVLVGLCCWSAVVAKIIAVITIVALTLFNLFLGPTIDTIKDNIKEELAENEDN